MSEKKVEELSIREFPIGDRDPLVPILEESFEGWYLWHSRKTLKEIETAKAALIQGRPVGVALLKMLDPKTGYVYYIAVLPKFRGRGIAGKLLDDSLRHFFNKDANTVLAGISEDNAESKALFSSRGFSETSFSRFSKRYGRLHAINMYRKMVIVSGEVVYEKQLSKSLTPETKKKAKCE